MIPANAIDEFLAVTEIRPNRIDTTANASSNIRKNQPISFAETTDAVVKQSAQSTSRKRSKKPMDVLKVASDRRAACNHKKRQSQ